MSDLHNLTDPIEDPNEEKTDNPQSQEEKQTEDTHKDPFLNKMKSKAREKADAFLKKYFKKLLISFGIATVLCIVTLWGASVMLSPNEPPKSEPTPQEPNEEPTQNLEESTKYTKFEGNQYYFYYPNSYGFLDRTYDVELNEITFSSKDSIVYSEPAILLKELPYWGNSTEEIRELIAFETTAPIENINLEEITIGDVLFYKTEIQACKNFAQFVSDCNRTTQDLYATEVNNLLILFQNSLVDQEVFEQTILNTFTPSVVDSSNLSRQYITNQLRIIKTKIYAYILLGKPVSENTTKTPLIEENEIAYQTTDDLYVILRFDQQDNLTDVFGARDNIRFNFRQANANSSKPVSPLEAYDFLKSNDEINENVLEPNPSAEIFIEQDPDNENYWLITISSPDAEDSIELGEYSISMETGELLEE